MILKYTATILFLISFVLTLQAQQADSVKHWMDEGERLFNEGQFENAKITFEKASKAVNENSNEYVECLNNLGNVAGYQGQPEEAIRYYQLALKKVQYSKDSIASKSSILKNIGATHSDLKDFTTAMKYLSEAEMLARKSGKSELIADCLNNKGIIYEQTDSIQRALEVYEEARDFYRSVNDIERLALVHVNIGVVAKNLERWDDAVNAYDSALYYARAIPNTFYESVILNNQGNLLSKLGRHQQAIANTIEALRLARELGQLNLVQDCLESLADQYAASGDHRKAYTYHKEFSALKDSLINDERISALSEMETKYEVEKKELQLAKLETENLLSEKANTRLGIWIAVLIVALIIIVITVILRQRINKLEQKRKALELVALTEKQERERIAKDMHDELGSGISRITWITAAAQRDPDHAIKTNSFEQIEGISEQLAQGMKSLIWLLNTGDTSWEMFIAKIRELTSQVTESQDISVGISGTDVIKGRILKQNAARDIMLLIKEATHNAVKYARAKNLHIQFYATAQGMTIHIEDNGIGFDMSSITRGHGLTNMMKRAKELQGDLSIESKPGHGTKIILNLDQQHIFTS